MLPSSRASIARDARAQSSTVTSVPSRRSMRSRQSSTSSVGVFGEMLAAAFDMIIDRKNAVNAIATRNDSRPFACRATASPMRSIRMWE